jgi:hypothetical protein
LISLVGASLLELNLLGKGRPLPAEYDFATIPMEKEVRTNQNVGMKMALERASSILRAVLKQYELNLGISQLQIIVRLK